MSPLDDGGMGDWKPSCRECFRPNGFVCRCKESELERENARLKARIAELNEDFDYLKAAAEDYRAKYEANRGTFYWRHEFQKTKVVADRLAETAERALDAWADNREGLLEEMRRLEEALDARKE